MEQLLDTLTNWLPVITIIISGIVSYLTAKFNAKTEIKKAMISINRENKIALNNAFSEFMAKTDKYFSSNAPISKTNAIKANAEFLAVAPKELHPIILEIDVALNNNSKYTVKELRDKLYNLFSQYVQNSN